MAKKKKTQKPGATKGKTDAPPQGAGFDDVDDFFFGSEAGAFKREEFDYDPFEDHSSMASGTVEAATSDKTRMALEVPGDVQTSAGKAVTPKDVAAKDKKPKGKAKDKKKKPLSAKERKAEERKRKADEKAAAAAPNKKAAHDKRHAAQERRATEAKRREDLRKADQERRDREAREAEERRQAAKKRKDDERKEAEKKRKEERAARAEERRVEAEARREAAAKKRRDAEEAAAKRAAEARSELERKAEEERARRDEKAAKQKTKKKSKAKEPAPVPLSERRAAGRAAAEAMAQEEVVVGGDLDEEESVSAEATKPAGAVEVLDTKADAEPEDAEAEEPKAAAEEADADEPVEIPEDGLPGAGDWSTAITELRLEAAATKGKKGGAKRATLRFEVGRILAQRIGDWKGAEEQFEAALKDDAKNLPALRELVRVFAARQEWSRAVDLLARQADAADEDASRSAALLGSAHIQLSQLDRLPEAAADLQRALQIFPDNYIALRFLREIHYRTQNWSALVEVLRSARDLAGPGERLRIDYELGRLHDEVLKDPAEAISGFKACLAADGRFIPAYLAAERLLTEAAKPGDLGALLSSFGDAWGGADAAFCHAQASRTAATSQGNDDAIEASYKAALEAAGGRVLAEEYRHWLEQAGRWDALVGACESAIEGDVGPRLRSHLNSLLGRVALQHNGDSGAAFTRYEAALAADPTSVEAREGKRRVLQATSDWAGLLTHLGACAEATTELRSKLAYALEMAEVADIHLDDTGAARGHLEAAVGMSPNYLPALDSLAEVLRRAGDHAARAEHLEAASRLVDTPEAKACYLLRASRAFEQGGDRPRAIATLKEASVDGPGSLLAKEWLVEAYIDDGKWAEAAETLRQAAAEVDDTALRVSLLYRSGRISLSRCDDLDAAEAAYRSLLDVSEDFLPAVNDLRDIHFARGDWDSVGLMQQEEAERRSNDGVRGWWHVCAGQSYERAGRTDDALGQYREALAVDGTDPVANSALRRVFRSAGDHAALADAYGDQLRRTADPKQRDALRIQLIATLTALGDAPSVATEVNELLKSDRTEDLPLSAMGVLCEGLQIWDEAIRAYKAVGDRDNADAAVRAACLFQQGLLLEEVQEDQVGAAALYERAHELSGGHAMALEGLERVRAQQEDGAALSAVYTREAEAAETQPVRTFYALLAGEQAENLGRHADAAKAYRQAFGDPVGRDRAYDALRRLSLQAREASFVEGLTDQLTGDRKGNDAVSRWMELGEGLASIGSEDAAAAAFAKALELRPGFLPVHHHLERLHTDREEWNDVLTALEGLASSATADKVKKAVEARTQHLLEERGVTSDSAWDFYKKLHGRDAKNLVALRGLGGISLTRGDHDAARGYYDALAKHAADPIVKAEAATQLARIVMEHSKDDKEAVRQLESALDHHATHRPALELLREIHTRKENWSGLVTVLARESALVAEDQRVPYFVEIAKLWEEKIGNAKVAISSWNKVLQEDAHNATALEHLLALYEGQENWTKYLDTADKQLTGLHGGAIRERQAELGLIAMDKADAPERAIGYLEQAAEGDQPAVAALEALRRIADSRGDWERVIALSRKEAGVVTEVPKRVELYEEAARIRVDELLDQDGAAELYALALALDDKSPASLQFFVRHHYDEANWKAAATVFAAYEPVIETMDIEEDDDARIEATAFHYKYGVVLSRTSTSQAALKRFARALDLTPTHLPSLEEAAPRYLEGGDLEKARATYRAILRLRGGTGDSETMTKLYLQLGETELKLGDSASGLKRFKKVLQLSKNNVSALQGIAQIHRLAEDWNSLLSTYNSIIKYARDPDQVIQAYMTKGDVLEQKLKFTDKAVLHYEKVLMYDKQNVQAMTRLGQIALAADDTDRAGALAERALGAAQMADEKVQAALLKALAHGGDSMNVDDIVGSVRESAGDGEALAAFSAALGGKKDAPRSEAASAYRETFATF